MYTCTSPWIIWGLTQPPYSLTSRPPYFIGFSFLNGFGSIGADQVHSKLGICRSEELCQGEELPKMVLKRDHSDKELWYHFHSRNTNNTC